MEQIDTSDESENEDESDIENDEDAMSSVEELLYFFYIGILFIDLVTSHLHLHIMYT